MDATYYSNLVDSALEGKLLDASRLFREIVRNHTVCPAAGKAGKEVARLEQEIRKQTMDRYGQNSVMKQYNKLFLQLLKE